MALWLTGNADGIHTAPSVLVKVIGAGVPPTVCANAQKILPFHITLPLLAFTGNVACDQLTPSALVIILLGTGVLPLSAQNMLPFHVRLGQSPPTIGFTRCAHVAPSALVDIIGSPVFAIVQNILPFHTTGDTVPYAGPVCVVQVAPSGLVMAPPYCFTAQNTLPFHVKLPQLFVVGSAWAVQVTPSGLVIATSSP